VGRQVFGKPSPGGVAERRGRQARDRRPRFRSAGLGGCVRTRPWSRDRRPSIGSEPVGAGLRDQQQVALQSHAVDAGPIRPPRHPRESMSESTTVTRFHQASRRRTPRTWPRTGLARPDGRPIWTTMSVAPGGPASVTATSSTLGTTAEMALKRTGGDRQRAEIDMLRGDKPGSMALVDRIAAPGQGRGRSPREAPGRIARTCRDIRKTRPSSIG